jgi:hypothetical protein
MAHIKRISPKEKEFAHLIVEGLSPPESARKTFGWKCESYSKENVKAYNLAKTKRVKDEIEKLRARKLKEAEVQNILITGKGLDWEKIRKLSRKCLEDVRDDETKKSKSRFDALKALEKLADPSADVNLIWRWIDIIWHGAKAHCPRCHNDFPLWKVRNERLETYRISTGKSQDHPEEEDDLTRRLELISYADKGKRPHPHQVIALEAPERHLVGKGAARGGKSYLLGLFAFMFFLLPGVEVWVLARIYEDSRSEIEFLRGFLQSAFRPLGKHMFSERVDHASGETIFTSRWNSELRVKSAKSKGSVTGRELEACIAVEPAWIDDDLYEEVRARMSSRLGRILAFGTPKGYGGFLARMHNLTGRDPKTKKILRLKPEDRLIRNGAKWSQSMLIYSMDPTKNPEYVKSEQEAARMELTDAEYASEFRGEMTSEEGVKFPQVKEYMIRKVSRDEYSECSFVQGVDQGQRNFGGVISAWNGDKVFVVREYFDDSNKTIKANMLKLRKTAPMIIESVGGHSANFNLTIFDEAPSVDNILIEMDQEGNTWPTPVTFRHRNKAQNFDNWRDETVIWVNQMALAGKLVFDEECDQLLWQVLDCLDKPDVKGKEGKSPSDKGWVVRDPWRGDHVLDAWLMSMWAIVSNQLELPPEQHEIKRGWEDHQAAFNYRRAADEARELAGSRDVHVEEGEIFQEHFGRPRKPRTLLGNNYSYYKDY